MGNDAWNPDQYAQFKRERSQPFYDLMDLLRPTAFARVVDLGCGTGELTVVLHERIMAKETLGLDSSASMLAKHPEAARLRFEQGDIATFNQGGWDILLSNAALHWLPDHPALFARLTKLIAPAGQLAVQMPANNDHPTHQLAHALAQEEPYASALKGYKREWPVLAPEAYASLLFKLGYAQQQVRLQVYPHVLESRDASIEWVKGTLLTDYEKRLGPALYAKFLADYRARIAAALPDERPFFFPFKRILIWARRKS